LTGGPPGCSDGDTSGDDSHANECDEHRTAPFGRLIRLVLFEDIDEAEVEVLADRGCWGFGSSIRCRSSVFHAGSGERNAQPSEEVTRTR